MKVSDMLDRVGSGDIALPEFQRGRNWNNDHEAFDVPLLCSSPVAIVPVGSVSWVLKKAQVMVRNSIHRSGNVSRMYAFEWKRCENLHQEVSDPTRPSTGETP